MKFLLDENVHHGLIPFLASLRHEAILSPKGITNGKVLEMAIDKGRILISHDSDFSRAVIEKDHPGIIFLKIPSQNFEALKNSIQDLLRAKSSSSVFKNKLFVLYEDRWEEFPFKWERLV